MPMNATPSIAFNRVRNDIYRLAGISYISSELSTQIHKMFPLLDLLEAKFTAEYVAHMQQGPKMSKLEKVRHYEAMIKAAQQAQIAVVEKKPFTANPYPSTSPLHAEFNRIWWYYTQGKPGNHWDYVAPDVNAMTPYERGFYGLPSDYHRDSEDHHQWDRGQFDAANPETNSTE
jgi:hypothetical protein